MKKFFSVFFIVLGVIFSIILLFVLYLFVFDPFNIKPLFNQGAISEISENTDNEDGANANLNTSAGTSTGTPFLSDSQKQTLATFGIDPASLPSSITTDQEACFKLKLGDARFAEISAGASPSIAEFLNAKSCL